MKHLKTPEKHKGKSIKFIMEKNKMTLEENVLKIIDKLKSFDGKMLTIQKRIKVLEAAGVENKRILDEFSEALLQRLDKLESKPCFESTGEFIPNAKFLKWFSEVFKDPIVEAVEEEPKTREEVIEEILAEPEADEVSPEVLVKLDEVVNDG